MARESADEAVEVDGVCGGVVRQLPAIAEVMQVVDDFLQRDTLVDQSAVDYYLPEPFGGTGAVGVKEILRGLERESRELTCSSSSSMKKAAIS